MRLGLAQHNGFLSGRWGAGVGRRGPRARRSLPVLDLRPSDPAPPGQPGVLGAQRALAGGGVQEQRDSGRRRGCHPHVPPSSLSC